MKNRLLAFGIVLLLLIGCVGGHAVFAEEVIRDEPSTGKLEFRIYGEYANNELYNLESVEPLEDNILTGKTIYWLGSSVTYGAASQQVTMVDYIAARNNAVCVKEAVSGTTLFTYGKNAEKSYVSRMLSEEGAFDPDMKIDAFICQISTNDVKAENLGQYGELPTEINTDLNSFDLTKTLDSVQYVIEYVKETWDCPIYFYAGSWFGDEKPRGNADPSGSNYAKLIADVHTIADMWNSLDGYTVKVIDMYNDEEFNDLVTDSDYEYLMGDAIHPRQAGYLVWWTPYFEDFLCAEFENSSAR